MAVTQLEGTNCKCEEATELTGDLTWCLTESPVGRYNLTAKVCHLFLLQEKELDEMALAQLNFHLKMVFASTGTCSLTLHYPCSVTSQSASALAMSRIKNVMIMPLRCKNVSPRPWKSLVHCHDTSIREKHVYPKSLELERVVSILGHPTIASAAKRESLWPVFTPDTDFFFPKVTCWKIRNRN